MTHRSIAPIDINGFEPGGTPRALPIFEWVDPTTLLIDGGYQRESSERSLKLVRKIVAGWDWGRFKPPVAVLTDVGLELIDGQHTAIAAATHPDIDKIPVMIVEVPERSERAGAFIGHNRDRVAVTALQLHVAAVAAGDADAMAVARVAAGAGVTVLTRIPGASRYKPGTTVGVAAISSLIRGRGEAVAIKVLSVLTRAGLAPINGIHMRAADLLLNTDEYSTQITEDQLVGAIQAMALKIDSEVAVFRAAHPATPTWKAMAILWFRARRGATKASTNITGNIPKVATLLHDVMPPADLKTASGKFIENITHRPALVQALKPSNRDDSCKRDARPKLSGWIPGPVLRRCPGCDEKYTGDVKSRSCADCAYGCSEVSA